jgi:UDP-glucuronate decarboxylase
MNKTAPDEPKKSPRKSGLKDAIRKPETVVLVAGAAGFIGSHIARSMCDLGFKVIGVDNFSNGSEDTLADLKTSENFELIEADLVKEIPESIRRKKIDYVIDAAGVSPHVGKKELILPELLNNSHGLKNLLDLANRLQSRFVYISSVDIYQGLASHENLMHYFDGVDLSTYYSFLEAKRYGEALCYEYVQKFGLDIRVARIGEVYGPGMSLENKSLLAKAIKTCLAGQDLIMEEEGSREHNLLYISDATYGIVKLALSNEERARNGIFYFVNPETVSGLSIAYILQNLAGKTIKVDFVPKYTKVDFPRPRNIDVTRSEKILRWDPEIKLTEGLTKTVQYYQQNDVNGEVKIPLVEIEQDREDAFRKFPEVKRDMASLGANIHTKSRGWLANKLGKDTPPALKGVVRKSSFNYGLKLKPKYVAFTLTGLVFIALIPLLLSSYYMARYAWSLNNRSFARAEDHAKQAEAFISVYQNPMTLVGLGGYYQTLDDMFSVAVYGSRVLDDLNEIAMPLMPIGEVLGNSWTKNAEGTQSLSSVELEEKAKNANLSVPDLKTDYAFLVQKINGIKDKNLPFFIRGPVRDIRDTILLFEPTVNNLDQIIANLDGILGYRAPQRYVVILQNNTELRATGGFIGSYAVFNLNQGRISDFKLDDIYNPDGLLTAHVDPALPGPIAKNMGVKFLGLRDVNWWPHFPVSMKNFTILYDRATQENITSVVAVNLRIIERLLGVTGNVYLDDYKENITAKNVFERAQYHAEVGFQPGSTQKKDFLTDLAEVVFNKVFSTNKYHVQLAKLFVGSLSSRDVMLYSGDEELEKVWTNADLAGSIPSKFGSDTLRVVDSNVGGNKANYWVDRNSSYSINVDRDGRLNGDLTVEWTHRGTSTSWPNGDYKNYVRVYVPQRLEGLKVEPPLADQEIYDEFGRTVVAGLVQVPIKSSQKIRVTYKLPVDISLVNEKKYQLIWENQPGLDEKVNFTVNLPSFLKSRDPLKYEHKLIQPSTFEVTVEGTEQFKK